MSRSPSDWQVGRILDAAGNRAAEGLRTLEEYARFVLEDRFLSEALKSIRHDLRVALETLPTAKRLATRAVRSDVGTRITVADESQRTDLMAVVSAAAARSQQALRSLEEYGKTLDAGMGAQMESLRYRVYTVAAAVQLMPKRHAVLADSRLYLLMPADDDLARFGRRVHDFYASGVDLIQLRDKQCSDALLYRLSRCAAEIARRAGKLFVVNDRADLAVASGAQGVHVGQDELPVEAVRRVVGPDVLVGVSTHDLDQVHAAVLDGADYIGCGPTFASQTKSFDEFPGIRFLAAASAQTTLPAFAIGGINTRNLDQVIGAAIHGVAVSGAILSAADPCAEAAAIKQRLIQSSPDKSGKVP